MSLTGDRKGGLADKDSDHSVVTTEGHADCFGLCVKFYALLRRLAPRAGRLDAAERHVQVSDKPAVDPDGACLDPTGDALRSVAIATPDGRRQAVGAAKGGGGGWGD